MQWCGKRTRKRFHEDVSAAIFFGPRRSKYLQNLADLFNEPNPALYAACHDLGYAPESGCDSFFETVPRLNLILRWRAAAYLGTLKTLRKLDRDTPLAVRLHRHDSRVKAMLVRVAIWEEEAFRREASPRVDRAKRLNKVNLFSGLHTDRHGIESAPPCVRRQGLSV